jgi:8-oxo-dGTP pyrophosphatase MutT (NUDIX family)
VTDLPDWWEPLRTRVASSVTLDFTKLPTPTDRGRPSAVLVLLGEGTDGGGGGLPGAGAGRGVSVLVLERAATLRTHAGQVAFPGGASDDTDPDLTATALREAHEEVGVDPASVTVVAQLPRLWIPVSDFLVTPVLAWWHAPHPVHPREPAEVARVARLPVPELVDPANRLQVRHPSGYVGPAFQVAGMLVWGFTAGVLATLLELAGWARPWSRDRVADLPRASAWPVP